MAIAFDTSSTSAEVSGTPASGSFNSGTVGTLSNGVAVVILTGQVWTGTMSIPSVTYGGASMTSYAVNVNNTSKQAIFFYYLVNPPSGVSSIVWTQGATKGQFIDMFMGSYSGVNQTSPFESSATGFSGTAATTVTVTAPTINSTDWGLIAAQSGRGITASTNVTARQGSGGGSFYGDSNGVITTGTVQTLTISATGTNNDALAAYLFPSGIVTVNVNYLVVGGGAGGGGASAPAEAGGGGGNGDVLPGIAAVVSGTSYTITVGTGSTGGSVANGNNSVALGITAIGGGYGGAGNGQSGNSGGSGGGGGANNSANPPGSGGTATGAGTSGGTGRSQNNSTDQGGGGGGASTPGTNATGTGSNGATGGTGTTSSISGSSVVYGDGGGGGYKGAGLSTGGSGNGGTGGDSTHAATDGIANTGSGGGGAGAQGTAGAGATGVVIFSSPVGTLTATGGTHTVSGGNDIWTFTTSGTWVPTMAVPVITGGTWSLMGV